MKVERTIEINAPPDRVWEAMMDVEKWPTWTESVLELQREHAGPFAVGSRARIKLKGAPVGLWRVTKLTPGTSFTWETERPPKMVASHVIEPADSGSRVTLAVESRGLVGAIFGPLMKRMTERNVQMEAEGLKRVCEAA